MIIKTALELELRMSSLAAMLIYVSSRVHVSGEVCLCRSLVKDHIDTV